LAAAREKTVCSCVHLKKKKFLFILTGRFQLFLRSKSATEEVMNRLKITEKAIFYSFQKTTSVYNCNKEV
jgi:hypothetical protein